MKDNLENDYDSALIELISEINDELMKDQAVLYITYLRKRYIEILAEKAFTIALSYRSDRLQKRLVEYFGSSIQIVSTREKPNLICSSTMPVGVMFSLASEISLTADDTDS